MDRGLWYALNTTGRKKPFIESVAVFTQASWESFARDSGYVLTKPCLEGAIDGVENYLVQVGLVPTPMKEKP
jgi:intracellular multiplication protein IcmP